MNASGKDTTPASWNSHVLMEKGSGNSSILYEVDSFRAYITLNREKSLNALTFSMLQRLDEVVKDIHGNSQVRMVVISGAGDRAFSAGMDLQELEAFKPEEIMEFQKLLGNICSSIEGLPQPTVAAVNGYAFGAGLELALACDIRIGIEHALLGFTDTSFGLIPGSGGTQRLPRLIGESRALEMILTGRRVTTTEALAYGLFTKTASHSSFSQTVEDYADLLLQNAPIAMAQAKSAMKKGLKTTFAEGLLLEGDSFRKTVQTEDRMEAMAAYREKRRPVFKAK
ncbi:enoyl-CoA hydratase-related protein [Peribacillus kribbensis]|uniref:enoyl-CoA hydratase-related protein n=1 Tax=Peribacillus kribbensis TaxID=356658 RepID=UPI00040F8C22|nr:enoyl-CoA hydratase-related protein [Peribacillus kribbensis]